ncbi:MAG: hypothetical protein R3C11_02930 [Planctomycetaceae bacterium]
MSAGQIYIKRESEILGPYSWNELNDLAQEGKLRARELVGDSEAGPFENKSMQHDLFLDYLEDPRDKLIPPRLLIRITGTIFLLINLLILITAGATLYTVNYPGPAEKAARAGMSADNRMVYAIDNDLAHLFFWPSLLALPGAWFFCLGRRFYVSLSSVLIILSPFYLLLAPLIFVLPLAYLLEDLFSYGPLFLLVIVPNLVAIPFLAVLIWNRKYFK